MDLLTTLAYLFFALAILSVLVLIHELGHFFVAKKIGVWAEEFGVGLPPRLWGKKIGETIYSINLLPIGGFVRLHGEVGEDSKNIKYPDKAFANKKPLPRIAVAVAGVIMNIVFAWFCFSAIYAFTGVPNEIGSGVIVNEVAPSSPAEISGLSVNDRLIVFNGQEISFENFSRLIDENKGKSVTIGTDTGKIVDVLIRQEAPEGEGLLGVGFTNTTFDYPKWYEAPFQYLKRGGQDTFFWAGETLRGFKVLFSEVASGQAPQGVMGPVGIVFTLSEFAKTGVVSVLGLTGIISINLALLNLLPFPPLDGSRVVLIIAESIFGKKSVRKHEGKLHLAGMGVLLILIAFMTLNEVPKLIKAGSVSGFVNTILSVEQ